jgi:hypothetical protein
MPPETEVIRGKSKKEGHFWLFVTLLFFGILAFVIYSSFYAEEGSFSKNIGSKITGTITGNTVKSHAPAYTLKAELSVPETITIDSTIEKIGFKVKEPVVVIVGNQHVRLSKDASLIIDNFEGSFVVSSRSVSELKGKAGEVFANGIPIQEKSGQTIRVVIEEPFEYTYIDLDGVYLNYLSYLASGTVSINKGKILVTLNKELFEIQDFTGNLDISRSYLKADGSFYDFDIEDFAKKRSLNSS